MKLLVESRNVFVPPVVIDLKTSKGVFKGQWNLTRQYGKRSFPSDERIRKNVTFHNTRDVLR